MNDLNESYDEDDYKEVIDELDKIIDNNTLEIMGLKNEIMRVNAKNTLSVMKMDGRLARINEANATTVRKYKGIISKIEIEKVGLKSRFDFLHTKMTDCLKSSAELQLIINKKNIILEKFNEKVELLKTQIQELKRTIHAEKNITKNIKDENLKLRLEYHNLLVYSKKNDISYIDVSTKLTALKSILQYVDKALNYCVDENQRLNLQLKDYADENQRLKLQLKDCEDENQRLKLQLNDGNGIIEVKTEIESIDKAYDNLYKKYTDEIEIVGHNSSIQDMITELGGSSKHRDLPSRIIYLTTLHKNISIENNKLAKKFTEQPRWYKMLLINSLPSGSLSYKQLDKAKNFMNDQELDKLWQSVYNKLT